ncbi:MULTISPECIES: hypothetical protein [unclassified Luteibacter]|uniref:hypothetical protein n=1 Tax=Luteibacter sp. PvP019 TaxID=3156436 RepID=UPI0033947E49
MKKNTSSKTQTGKLDGPFQVFRVVETDVNDAGSVTESEHFIVCLENFGFISGFIVERFALADAAAFNADFFSRIREGKPQERINQIYEALPAMRKDQLKKAMDAATKKFSELFDPSIRRRRRSS